MDRLVSLSVGVEDPEDFARTFQDLSELARNLGVTHDYVSVSSSVVDENLHEEPAGEDLYHDENTLVKVRVAAAQALFTHFGSSPSINDEAVTDLINEITNAGILFRERIPS